MTVVVFRYCNLVSTIQVGLMRDGLLLAESPPDTLIQSYSMTVSYKDCTGCVCGRGGGGGGGGGVKKKEKHTKKKNKPKLQRKPKKIHKNKNNLK